MQQAVKQLASDVKLRKEEEKKAEEFNASILATAIPDSDAFDETWFYFSISRGGANVKDNSDHIHTGIIIANATYRDGENAGLPVPLHCTWYNVT